MSQLCIAFNRIRAQVLLAEVLEVHIALGCLGREEEKKKQNEGEK